MTDNPFYFFAYPMAGIFLVIAAVRLYAAFSKGWRNFGPHRSHFDEGWKFVIERWWYEREQNRQTIRMAAEGLFLILLAIGIIIYKLVN